MPNAVREASGAQREMLIPRSGTWKGFMKEVAFLRWALNSQWDRSWEVQVEG